MNENLYYDGRQIKNYLIGFASIFSEIPYRDRYGKIKTVPIHYGSPSDVISFLEMNVDTEDTANRNRLKDISIPMLSFRMTGIERNIEKRRAPHDTITVDLRPLGYTVGYVAMRPAPYKFTMELVCWASSDYQAFEITEQIIPYFNSPQQVTIEPLPRCPISTTEIFLDNIEIDTDPASQKTGAVITMSFSLTGWMLTQPKIWSTNLQFELSMLDNPGAGLVDPLTNDYSFGTEIRDLTTEPKMLLPMEDRFSGLEGFILNTPALAEKYGEKLDLFNELIAAGRMDSNGNILDSNPLTIEYAGEERTLVADTMTMISNVMDDIKFVFANEQLQELMKTQSLEGNLTVLSNMFEDTTETIDTYLKLLDNNLATKGFNETDIQISNSEKLSIFGTLRIDISDTLKRMRMYLAGIENLKMNDDVLASKGIYSANFSVYEFFNKIPYDNLPLEIKNLVDGDCVNFDKTIISKITMNIDSVLVLTIEHETPITLVLQTINGIDIRNIDISTNEILLEDVLVNTSFGYTIIDENGCVQVKGYVKVDLNNIPDFETFDFRIFGLEHAYNIGINDGNEVPPYYDENLYNFYGASDILDRKFTEMDELVVSTLIFKQMIKERSNISELLKIVENKFGMSVMDIINNVNQLKKLFETSKEFIDLNTNSISPIPLNEIVVGQQTFSADLAQAIALDKNGKPIWDINGDGFINQTDLDLLGAVVDNPEDFDYELKYGIWYKRFDINKMEDTRIAKVMADLKVLFYLTEKNDYTEIYDYLYLLSKDLVVETYDLYPIENYQKREEVLGLGYDISTLDDKFLFMRLFLDGIKNIMVNEREYILYKVPDMNESSKAMLYKEEGLNIDDIIVGKYIQLYLNSILDSDERMLKEQKIREILPKTLGYYYDYIYEFNLFIRDIQESGLFIDSLVAETTWLEDTLPEVKAKIEEKYGL